MPERRGPAGLFYILTTNQKDIMDIKYTEVKSSNIEAVGYDAAAKRVHVRFKGDTEYSYDNVPKEAFDNLVNAESTGTWLNKHFKGNYDYLHTNHPDAPDYGMYVDYEDPRVKFVLHVIGPDEIFFFNDEITALRTLNFINKNVKLIRNEKNSWHTPVIYFPIVYTKEEYAAMDEEDYAPKEVL